jgi:hypothetical protein
MQNQLKVHPLIGSYGMTSRQSDHSTQLGPFEVPASAGLAFPVCRIRAC